MHPQGFASGPMQTFPAFGLLFVAVVSAITVSRQWRWPGWEWRIVGLLLLWAFFLFTTSQAKVGWAAWPRFFEITKIFVSLGLTLVLIDTRRKLYWLVVVTAASFSLVTLKGGYWALISGFSDRVYGPPGSQYYDNNLFAVAVIMTIPLLVLCLRQSGDRIVRGVLMALIGLGYAAALSSWSRGGLIALGLTTLVMLLFSRRRTLVIPVVVVAAVLAWFALPDAWFQRMATIGIYASDASAQSRLMAWGVGWKHAMAFPLTGVGLDGWHYAVVTMDWHNSYVEVLAEHGFIGFGIWLALLLGTLVSLVRLWIRHANDPATAWVSDYGAMLAASLVAYMAGSMFLGLSYWDILYHLIVMSVVLSRIVALGRGEQPRTEESSTAGVPSVGGNSSVTVSAGRASGLVA